MNYALPTPSTTVPQASSYAPHDLACLSQLERKVLWLSTWMIHHANHLRVNRDGLKVGGHQASCASAATLLTALYGYVLSPDDRIAVKPHASPVFHALQYLFGREGLDRLKGFRGFGGAQSYPSRTKDAAEVDFSTGSVGLGVGATLFAAMVQDYVRAHGLRGGDRPAGRMIALMGDAELDEGNVFEALLEGWKHGVRNLWWVIDYNRQSLDGVVSDRLFQKIQSFFGTVDWKVVTLKYGSKLQAAFHGPAGEALRGWIDDCPNDLYSALTFKGGDAWRRQLETDLADAPGLPQLLSQHDDASLHRLMTNLAGHDMAAILEAFNAARDDDTPHCFVAYTVKGYNLPFAGHKDNHSGLMNLEQMQQYKAAQGIADGQEWDRFAGLDLSGEVLQRFLDAAPFNRRPEPPKRRAAPIAMPAIGVGTSGTQSTQEGFGKVMLELGRAKSDFAARLVTTSPDVTVSTNLGGWVNQRGVFSRFDRDDVFRKQQVPSALKWNLSPAGQHVELGIAENNLFLLLGVLGLSESLFGTRLLPVGTLYDPFIARGLDALNYACYQDARFMLVATPSGLTLAPEGGAHQSIGTPLIGLGQPGLTMFEPAYVDELLAIMRWGFDHMQRQDGGSVYLRLSTRPLVQPDRLVDDAWRDEVIDGAYWVYPPAPGAELALVYCGAVAPEAEAAYRAVIDDVPGAGLLAVTSADRLYQDWRLAIAARAAGDATATAPIERRLAALAPDAALVTVLDGHPATLSWLGSASRHGVVPLGVDRFGQSGDIADLYRYYGIDSEAIIDAVASALLKRHG